MKYSKILLCLTALVCLTFQALAVSESPNNINSHIKMGLTNQTKQRCLAEQVPQWYLANQTSQLEPTNQTKQRCLADQVPDGVSSESIATGSSESNKTKVSSEPSTPMGSSGDYLNPNSISGGGYPNFPWYSTGGSFYSQGFSDSTFSHFRDYYTSSGMPVVGGIISTPSKFDIAQKTPSKIYYGTGQALPYSQYVSSVTSRTNELWVQGATDWSQYVVSPARNLATVSRLFARWRISRLLRDGSDQHNQSEVQHLSVQPRI